MKAKFKERLKITKKGINNIYSVDLEYINSIKFRRNIDNISCSKRAKNGIHDCILKILEERDGTYYESIGIIDSVTGKELAYNNKINKKFETGLFDFQKKNIYKNKNKYIAVHNHPRSTQLSYADIKTLMTDNKCSLAVAVGHTGIIYVAKKLKQVDIEKIYEATYDVMNAMGMKTDGNKIENQVVKILLSKKNN